MKMDISVGSPATRNGGRPARRQSLRTGWAALPFLLLALLFAGCSQPAVTPAQVIAIRVTPVNAILTKQSTLQLTAIGSYDDLSILDITAQVSWAAVDPTVATVSSTGLVTAAGPGMTELTATFKGVIGKTPVVVTPATLVALAVTPINPVIALGTTKTLVATGTFSDSTNQNLTAQATWVSSDSTVATVDTQGVVTSLSSGSTTISATALGKTDSTTLTVTLASLVSISVMPTNPAIAKGTIQQFTATGVFSDNTTQDITLNATWTSSDMSIASISNDGGARGRTTGAGVGTATLTAAFAGKTGKTSLTVTQATLASIAVMPVNPVIPLGTTKTFTATGTFSDSTSQNLTTQVTWAASDPTVATVDSQGVATSRSAGLTTISATLGGKTDSTNLTVTLATLVSISVTPTNPTIAKGTVRQISATGIFSDNSTQDITLNVTWASADTSIANISNAAGARGITNGVGVGTTTLTAAFGGKTGSTAVTVTAATVVYLRITPSNPAIAKGTTQPFIATGTYTDNTIQDVTLMATWASSDTTVAAISNAGGSQGRATAVGVGYTIISAAFGGADDTTALNVTNANLVSIAITPTNPTIAKGTTQQFIATGTYTDGSTQNLNQTGAVTWDSTNTAVATVDPQGLATSASSGPTTITAFFDGKTASTNLLASTATLTAIAVTPANPSIANGTTQQFIATGTFSDGSTQDVTTNVTWNTSDSNIATINNYSPYYNNLPGLATGAQIGAVTISAAFSGKTGSTNLTITAATLVSIAVTPSNRFIANNTTQQFIATGTKTDRSTEDVTKLVNWSAANMTIATISNAAGSQGRATAVGAGSTTISAALGGKTSSTKLTVTTATLVSIAVSPINLTIVKGRTQQFIATGTFSDMSTQDLTTPATWASSVVTAATISNAEGAKGLVTGVASGTTTISATLGGKTSSVMLSVWSGLQSASNYTTDASPSILAVGDFNKDGKLDLVIGSAGYSSYVSVLLGTGTGSFGAASGVFVSMYGFSSLVVGDFNNDGKLDIATTAFYSPYVSVVLGTGTGSFGPSTPFIVSSAPFSVTVGDFNKDGKLDLVTANPGSGDVSVLLGTGTGSFGPAVNYAAGPYAYNVAVGDFNKDGQLDLVVATSNSGNVSVLLGTGTGGFGPAANFASSSSGFSVAVGDVDGDGKLDLALVGQGNVIIMLGSGTGSFGPATQFYVGGDPVFVTMADFNGDGKLDLATANSGSGEVSVLLGPGDGSFPAAISYSVGTRPGFVATGEVNGN